jgi:hypothetical protein
LVYDHTKCGDCKGLELKKTATVVANLLKLNGIKTEILDLAYNEIVGGESIPIEVQESKIETVDELYSRAKITLVKSGFKYLFDNSSVISWFTKNGKCSIVGDAETCSFYVLKYLVEDDLNVDIGDIEEKFDIENISPDILDVDTRFTKICKNLYSVKYGKGTVYISFRVRKGEFKQVCADTRPGLFI